jgi:hypothetical protein
VVDAKTRLDGDHRGEPGIVRSGEDLATDARASQRGAKLANVNVHSAAIAGSWLGQR